MNINLETVNSLIDKDFVWECYKVPLATFLMCAFFEYLSWDDHWTKKYSDPKMKNMYWVSTSSLCLNEMLYPCSNNVYVPCLEHSILTSPPSPYYYYCNEQ